MKKTALSLLSLCFSACLFAQSYKVTWGEEIKLKKGTADIDVVAADNTGLYFTEERARTAIGGFGGGRTSYKLYKLDKNFSDVFDKDYKKELKGYDFHSFQMLDKDLFLFVTDYVKKEKLFKVLAAKLDKNSRELLGDYTELGSYQLESKRDDYELRLTSIQNGTAFLAVANISGKEKVSLGVSVLDKNLRRKENAVIDIAIQPGSYGLQDVLFTKGNKIVVLGKEFEETVIKKKRKRMVFKQYVMSVFDSKGKKLSDVNLNSGDKFVIGGKLIESATGEMLLAGFHSNTAKKEDLNGFFINKIDADKGVVQLSSYKQITPSMLGNGFEDPADEDDETKDNKKQKEKVKDDDDAEEFPNDFIIRSVDINPVDNSIIITSEVSKYSYYTYTTSQFNSSTKTWTHTTNYVHQYTNKDILVIGADKDGGIKWMNVVPKSQRETIRSSMSGRSGFSNGYDRYGYFAEAGGMPFYSSFTSLLHKNNLVLLVNDHASNNVLASYGDKVKTIYNFKRQSNVYGISIDLATGKMSKKVVSSNNNDAIMMPRHSLVVDNEIFIPSWRMHALAKTELKFAKLSVK